ncbi:hypothetical protein GN156_09925 [bacterium LRH843]|nr:hypothetical protein [bacterium LRH843]
MDLIQGIISTILKAFQAERSIYGVYHLLKGKKSAQTIQDGTFFSALSYFGIFPFMHRSDIEKAVAALVYQRDAIQKDDDRALLTEQGLGKLKKFHEERPYLDDLQGWQYLAYSDPFWLRLCLFLQALTHLVEGSHAFYPITHQTQIQNWVKQHLPRSKEKRREQLTMIHDELVRFLSTCWNEQAVIFVHQLSGKKVTGYTKQQLADQMNMHVIEIHLIHLATLHKLFNVLENKQHQFPVLSLFIADLKQELPLTESAKQTFSMLNKGASIEEISIERKLKRNTIEDHVVEIALQQPHFQIHSFVSKEVELAILSLAQTVKTTRLRELKEKLPSNVSYFMIRLVLAREKVKHET